MTVGRWKGEGRTVPALGSAFQRRVVSPSTEKGFLMASDRIVPTKPQLVKNLENCKEKYNF
jgi:hypothetical protein